MKVLFDNQCFYFNGKGGISRYFAVLIDGLKNDPDFSVTHLPHEVYDFFIKSSPVKSLNFKGFNRLKLEKSKRINKKFVLNELKTNEYDLFIPTYYDTYFLNALGKTPFVLVIHDMIPENFPDTKFKDISHQKRLLCEKAKAIICVSENTKNDLQKLYPKLGQKKIIVIYHGNSLLGNPKKVNIPEQYFLYIGGRHGYKNFEYLLDEILPILEQNKSMHLVCVGGSKFSKRELKLCSHVRSQLILIYPTDDELKFLYQHALGLIVPSKMEGFGIPLIEAMLNKCPLYLSDISVFREIAGDNAAYFQLEKGALNTLLDTPPAFKTDLAQEHAKKFSLQDMIDKTKHFFNQTNSL